MKKLFNAPVWLLSIFLVWGFAHAAEEGETSVDEEIIVTGTYVKGSPIDAASPVTTLTSEELERQGNPTILELIQKLEFVAGRSYGQTNQFQNNAGEGIASVNLRGLGANRTLVLINGQRQVVSPFRRGFVDVNQIPALALERVEILKEGASATYGSDAIAGVFNFITDKDFSGFEYSGSYQDVDNAESGQRQVGFKLGFAAGDSTHVVLTTSFFHQGRLSTRDRNWSELSYAESNIGGWSTIANPGTLFDLANINIAPSPYALLVSALGGIRDPNCELLGGVVDAGDSLARCRYNYLRFDNLLEEEERDSFFLQITHDYANGMTLDVNLLFANTEVPEWYTSPSYPPQELFGPVQYVPEDHPGLINMVEDYPEYDAYADTDGTGADTGKGGTFWGRVNGVAGYAPTGYDARIVGRDYQTFRFSGSLTGKLKSGIDYTASITHAEQEGNLVGIDEWISRTALAFRGFGGSGCGATISDIATGATNEVNIGGLFVDTQGKAAGADGCQYYNPFSNAIERSAINGVVNPNYDSSVGNDTDLIGWLENTRASINTTELSVVEVVVSNDTNVHFGGGNMAWAGGVQFRSFSEALVNHRSNDLGATPCPYSYNGVDYVDGVECGSPTGPTSFLAASSNYDASQDITAVFGELALPIADNFDIQIALRYEDYGNVGDTLDPKISLRYTPKDWLTLRLSASSTFRGPLAYESSTAKFTGLQFIAATGAFKAVDTLGNPLLEPESAQTYSAGLVFQFENFELTADVWGVDMDNPISTESHTQIVSRYSAAHGAAGTAATAPATAAGDAAVAALLAADPTADDDAQAEARKAAYDPVYEAEFLAAFSTVTASQIICAGEGSVGPMKASDLAAAGTAPCSAGGLTRIEVSYVNGPATLVEGADIMWRFFSLSGFELGMSGSYVSRYEIDAYLKGGEQIAAPLELVGSFNFGVLRPIPRWRGKLWLQQQWTSGSGREGQFRIAMNHIDGYTHARRQEPVPEPPAGIKVATDMIEAQTTFDLIYNTTFGDDNRGRFALNVFNLTDRDPPFAPADLNYDAFTHNPLGRQVKMSFRYKVNF